MSSLVNFVKQSYVEMITKVTWPSWKDLQSSSLLVLGASILISLIVFIMDYVFGINSDQSIWRGVLGWIYELI